MLLPDEALHLSYELDEEAFSSLAQDLWKLKQTSPVRTYRQPLSVHPGLAKTSLVSPLGDMVRNIILRHAGADRMVRFTFVYLRLDFSVINDFFWELGSAVIQNKRPVFEPITGVDADMQAIFTLRNDGTRPNIPVSFNDPFQVTNDTVPKLQSDRIDSIEPLVGSVQSIAKQPWKTYVHAMRSTHKIENPRTHSLLSTDCVSCHVAGKARAIGEKSRGKVLSAQHFRYRNQRHNLEPVADLAKGDFRMLRAFGYFRYLEREGASLTIQPSIIQRTVFESAEVADLMETNGDTHSCP